MPLTETLRLLAGDFVILDLGAANSRGLWRSWPDLDQAITLIEVDALTAGTGVTRSFRRRVVLRQAVAGQGGRRVFRRRKFPEVSSFLDPLPELVRDYALQDYVETVGTIPLDCATIADLLQAQGIRRVDFLKTDLEGLDFEVLASAPSLVRQALCVQCELRFQPFFQGEPPFHEVARYLHEAGHELVWLRPEIWKYATPHRDEVRDGRLVSADAWFFLRPSELSEQFAAETWKAIAKQVILARQVGLCNFAEHLFHRNRMLLPRAVEAELETWVAPARSLTRLLLARLVRLPGGWQCLGALRRLLFRGFQHAALFKDRVLGAPEVR